MLKVSDFINLPFTPDLTQAGIAYACRWLSRPVDSKGGRDITALRQIVARVAAELALKRYLRAQKIPFSLQGSSPFSDPLRMEVCLGGRWCFLNNTLITHKDQVGQLWKDPSALLVSPLVGSFRLIFTEQYSQKDLFIVAFTLARPFISGPSKAPCFIYPLPASWARPANHASPGRLAVKSNLAQVISIELGGLGEDREYQSESLHLPPGGRMETQQSYISVSYLQSSQRAGGKIGVYSPNQERSCLVQPGAWGNISVDGLEIILAGYLEFEELRKRSQTLRPGRYSNADPEISPDQQPLKVSALRSLPELFNTVKRWSHNQHS